MHELPALLILTFIGSSLGGICRYLLSGAVSRRFGERFPWGTLVVNITGSFLIGLAWGFSRENEDFSGALILHDFLISGFLGGYTTVSSFTLNTLNLIRNGEWRAAGLNLMGSYLFCLGAVFWGSILLSG